MEEAQSSTVPSTGTISGSVFVNDGNDATPADALVREPNELGIPNVRVDIASSTESQATISVLTDADGRFSQEVPVGTYTVRVTQNASQGAFNSTLFHAYNPAPPGDDAEREVTLYVTPGTANVMPTAVADFGFDPDLNVILDDLDGGSYTTNAEPLRVWRRWMGQSRDPRNCPAQQNWTCRPAIAVYLDSIFAGPQVGDKFFGNADPFVLGVGIDPFVGADRILSAHPRNEADLLKQELFVMQLNYFAGRGTPDRVYDLTLLSYLEEYVGPSSPAAPQLSGQAVTAAATAASAAATLQLQVARAYNGGGGGGEVGN